MQEAKQINQQAPTRSEAVVAFARKVARAKQSSRVVTVETGIGDVAGLVRRAKRGNRAAFDRLIERFEPRVLRIVVARLGNAADAREVAQEVFLMAYTKLAQLRSPEFFPRWLSRIAQRMAINRAVRRQLIVSVGSEALEARVDTGPSPLERAVEHERAVRLWDGLGRLRSMDREALLAFYIRGRSLNEISDEFDVPVGTVKRRLHVARKRLRTELEQLA